jgi:transposase
MVVRRRRFTEDFRRGLVQMTLVPGASVAKIALDHRLNTNLLFKWRQLYLRELAGPRGDAPKMLPVTVEQVCDAPESTLPEPRAAARSRSVSAGCIEIELPGGRVRLRGAVDTETLRWVLQVLSER